MRRGLIAIGLIALLLASAGVVSGQKTPESLCDESALVELADLLEGAATALRDGSEDIPTLLVTLQLLVGYTIADCTGLAFSSEVDGMQPVIGPVVIEAGLYRATATTDGFMIVEIEVLDGSCAEDIFGGLFGLFEGQGSDGAQAVMESAGCEALISVSNTTEPWTLSFEKLR